MLKSFSFVLFLFIFINLIILKELEPFNNCSITQYTPLYETMNAMYHKYMVYLIHKNMKSEQTSKSVRGLSHLVTFLETDEKMKLK